MANNPYANKVIYGNQTIMDLSGDTVVASDVLQGKTFHDATGALLVGTYTPSASGYTIHIFTEDSNLFGNTITISKDDVVLGTTTFDNTGNATFDVQQKGTYVASTTYQGTVYQKAVNVTDEFLVELSETIDGKTALPTDDIQIWLKCAGINDKSYTTLAEVLADTDTLLALINSNNAVDYMVRSTTWAVTITVPVMISDTSPSGECIGSSTWGGGNEYFRAYDNSLSTVWASAADDKVNAWIGYTWANKIIVNKFKLYSYTGRTMATAYVEGSNDGVTWDTLNGGVAIDVSGAQGQYVTYNFTNNAAYTTYRLRTATQVNASYNCNIFELQFYSEVGVTENATAMSYIGLNNYCANTLLADSTWCNAICNSEYFESVLNVKVPVMTSNTTPEGLCFASAGEAQAYYAFNGVIGDNTSSWGYGAGTSGSVGYKFTSAKKIYKASVWNRNYSSAMAINHYKIQGSNDNFVGDIHDLGTYQNTSQVAAHEDTHALTSVGSYQSYRINVQDCYESQFRIGMAQFYGREDIVEPEPVTERVLYDRGTENTPFTMGASPAFKNAAVKQQDAIQMNYSSSSSYGFKTTDAIDVSDYDTLKVYIAVNGDEQTENYQFVATADLSRYSTVQLLIGYIGNTVQIQASETVGGTRYVIGADGSRYNLAVKVYKIWLEKSCVNC